MFNGGLVFSPSVSLFCFVLSWYNTTVCLVPSVPLLVALIFFSLVKYFDLLIFWKYVRRNWNNVV